ncbi:MAG: zinc ABC transporter substrate-binding protein, partial [Clostridia bacterium]|nr:zinc ABC transporter substrate-binding protein [Clostridia bacterium]
MKKVLILVLVFILALSGCTAAKSDKIQIATTIFPEYDFARAVAGDLADVSMLIPAGSDMHSFEPTAQDLAKISESQLFIYVGGESDKWVEKVLENVNPRKTKVLRLLDVVEIKDGADEHIWT